jgi:hypothetical protein
MPARGLGPVGCQGNAESAGICGQMRPCRRQHGFNGSNQDLLGPGREPYRTAPAQFADGPVDPDAGPQRGRARCRGGSPVRHSFNSCSKGSRRPRAVRRVGSSGRPRRMGLACGIREVVAVHRSLGACRSWAARRGSPAPDPVAIRWHPQSEGGRQVDLRRRRSGPISTGIDPLAAPCNCSLPSTARPFVQVRQAPSIPNLAILHRNGPPASAFRPQDRRAGRILAVFSPYFLA